MQLDAARHSEQFPDSDIKLADELPSSAVRPVTQLRLKCPHVIKAGNNVPHYQLLVDICAVL